MSPKRVVLTDAALDAALLAVSAALAGEEGEGDMSNVSFADLERAHEWLCAQRARRRQKRARKEQP